MPNLSSLVKIVSRSQKRRGRGRGSGKGGHTVGRGQKGQRTRDKIPLTFEGTKIKKSLLKRLPLLRGKGKLGPRHNKPLTVNLKYLNLLPGGSVVTVESLIAAGIVGQEAKSRGVKILGEGNLERQLAVSLSVSRGAKAKIEKAGGQVGETKTPSEKKIAKIKKSKQS